MNTPSDYNEYVATGFSCECAPFYDVNFNGDIPHDSGSIPSQKQANCFAWQEFIALNWPADGPSNFGAAGINNPVVWETYLTKEMMLPANGQSPPPWGAAHPKLNNDNKQKRVLMHASKFTTFNDTIQVSETGQAAPESGPNWLGASNNTNLWYEVLVNKDEYDYITNSKHQFYNADKQLSWVKAGNRIQFPKGSNSNDTIGAMEIKAAWMEILPTTSLDKARYKMTEAVIIDPITGAARDTQVGLIGMHIIHKMESQPTWLWATFEHVDNAPIFGITPSGIYNLYNASCQDKTIQIAAAYSKTGKDETVTISCDATNVSPPYYLKKGGPKPMALQVKNETPLSQNSKDINLTIQQAIKKYYPSSVFQYYQLVDVIWSSGPTLDSNQPTKTPLHLKSMNPSNSVANNSMETYALNTKCTDCHQYGAIAGNSGYASDFSFVLSSASAPE
jgi:hypothetical protein